MAQNGRLAGKVALVTGAAQGIGEGIARVLAEHGAVVIAADIQDDRGRALAEELGGGASYLRLDVCDPAAWTAAAGAIRTRHGRLDILVNNAGWGMARALEETTLDEHRRMMTLNVDAVWIGVRALAAMLEEGAGGSIVNISSMDGLVGVTHMASYVASKFAVTGMTRALAIELGARGIRVNSVHPGMTEVPAMKLAPAAVRERLGKAIARQPIARFGTPREIGQAVLFFASDESAYCTGAALVVDGGHIAGPYRDPLE